MLMKNAHCSYCGQAFGIDLPWPRTCSGCGQTSFLNPLPVAVVLLPVGPGLLVVRRSVAPRQGMLALPGGYVNFGESWQAAGAREVWEETGIELDPADIQDFYVRSAPDSTILIFGLAKAVDAARLPPFIPNAEASERLVITQPEALAFPLHTDAVNLYFQRV